MSISVSQDNSKAYFQVSGNIYETEADQLKNEFKALNIQTIKEVTINFSKVTHIGSAGIGKILLLYKDLAAEGGTIRIENMSTDLYELFLSMKLESLFTLSKA